MRRREEERRDGGRRGEGMEGRAGGGRLMDGPVEEKEAELIGGADEG